MDQHVKIFVWVKAAMLVCSLILCGYAFLKSKIMGMQIKVRGISYMMAGSKPMYEIMRRALLIMWGAVNFIVLTWQVNRASGGYYAYHDSYAEWSSLAMVIFLLLASVLYFVFYTPRAQDWLEKIFYKDKNEQL
jgi:hypothetical protein